MIVKALKKDKKLPASSFVVLPQSPEKEQIGAEFYCFWLLAKKSFSEIVKQLSLQICRQMP